MVCLSSYVRHVAGEVSGKTCLEEKETLKTSGCVSDGSIAVEQHIRAICLWCGINILFVFVGEACFFVVGQGGGGGDRYSFCTPLKVFTH